MSKVKHPIQYRHVSQLVPLEGNPRSVNDKEFINLRESIRSMPGFFEARPIIISNRTKSNVIIAGNQRYHAAIAEGITEVPTCLIENLSKEEEDEITYRDNEHAGEWDMKSFNKFFSEAKRKEWGLDIKFSEEDDEYEKEINSFNDDNCEYPIVPKFSEKYSAVLIVIDNEIDEAFVKNVLQLEKSKSYKNSKTGTSYVVDVAKFKAVWESR